MAGFSWIPFDNVSFICPRNGFLDAQSLTYSIKIPIIQTEKAVIFNMTGELLYDYLSETKAVTRFGRNLLALDFSLPMFYLPGNEPENGRIYICRSSDLPRTCSVSSCFICLGSRPTYIWNNWKGMALYLEDPAEYILSLSNLSTTTFYSR